MGILDFNWLNSDPGSEVNSGLLSTKPGGSGQFGPLSGGQKAAMLFAGLRDAVGAFSGQQSNNLQSVASFLQQQRAQRMRQDIGTQLQAAVASGDKVKARQLLVSAVNSGIDPEPIMKAMNYGQTEYSTTPQQLSDGSWVVIGKDGSEKPLSAGIAQDPNKPFSVGTGGKPIANADYQNYEMGKAKASKPSVTVNYGNSLGSSLAGGVGDILKQSQNSANGALQTIDTANQIRTAISSGKVMAGPTTSWRMAAQQLFGGDQDTLNQTRLTIQGLAKLSLAGRSALKGQGQISDFEGKLLERAASGNIDSMTVGEIETIANVADRAARLQIKANKGNIDRISKTLPPEMSSVLGVYNVDEPPPYTKSGITSQDRPDPLGIRR